MASAYEVANAAVANAAVPSAAVLSGTRLKFTDLCEDVIRLICESLDVESHISLFITVGPMAFGDLYKKIKNTRCIKMFGYINEIDNYDTDLIYYVAMLKPEERVTLIEACGGELPFNLDRGLNCLLPLLPDHTQLLNTPRHKATAKRYLKKYGALRHQPPETMDFIENLAIKCVLLNPAAPMILSNPSNTSVTRLSQFIALAFDINMKHDYWNKSPTNHTPSCFRNPTQALKQVLEGQSAEDLLTGYMALLKNYQAWYQRFIHNRKQTYGTMTTDAQARYDELMLLGPYMTGF